MMLKTVEAMSRPLHQVIHKEYVEDKEKYNLPSDFEARMNKIGDDSMKNMPWDQMIQATVPVYQKHFTKGDMDALIAFYSGPTGQKLLREMPAVMAYSMRVTMPVVLQQNAAMSKRLKQEFDRIKKDSQKKSPDSGSAREH